MSTKREKYGRWEYTIRRKGLLPRPLYLRFDTEKEGDDYVARLEALLDRGIVPPEFGAQRDATPSTIGDAIRAYRRAVHIPESDAHLLETIDKKFGKLPLAKVTYEWVEAWVLGMKRVDNMAPSTIRHHVGSFARCLDWQVRKSPTSMPFNPVRNLPRRYAVYTEDDARALASSEKGVVREDTSRERRLTDKEETAIRRILNRETPKGRQRALVLRYQPALCLLFELALEEGMRMGEIYTLAIEQVNFKERTIFLDKTKNGDKRQVPLTSVALKALREYIKLVRAGDSQMGGWNFNGGKLFPWWDDNGAERTNVTATLSHQFARIFSAAGCTDLRFHDLRHEAVCRYYTRTKLTDLQVMKIFGWKSPKMAARYANLRGSDLSKHLW